MAKAVAADEILDSVISFRESEPSGVCGLTVGVDDKPLGSLLSFTARQVAFKPSRVYDNTKFVDGKETSYFMGKTLL